MKTHFCWIYHSENLSSKGTEELRYSMRSIETFLKDTEVSFTLIGSIPVWYAGHHIPIERYTGHNPLRYFDTLKKLKRLVADPYVPENFFWMMDDVYLIKPTTVEELQIPRHDPNEYEINTEWRAIKKKTQEHLRSAGVPCLDYATHLPHFVNKTNLRHLFSIYPMTTPMDLYLWEILYGSLFYENPQPYFPYFKRVLRKLTPDELREHLKDAVVTNNNVPGWGLSLRAYLNDLLPAPSYVETTNES
jgi:hypothetical protein